MFIDEFREKIKIKKNLVFFYYENMRDVLNTYQYDLVVPFYLLSDNELNSLRLNLTMSLYSDAINENTFFSDPDVNKLKTLIKEHPDVVVFDSILAFIYNIELSVFTNITKQELVLEKMFVMDISLIEDNEIIVNNLCYSYKNFYLEYITEDFFIFSPKFIRRCFLKDIFSRYLPNDDFSSVEVQRKMKDYIRKGLHEKLI